MSGGLEKLLFICALCASAFLWKSRPNTISQNRAKIITRTQGLSNVLKTDAIRFKKNFKKEILQNENWNNLNNYSISEKELINQNNAADFFRLTSASMVELVSCLKKDFCGMERRNSNDAYFDELNTPGHILLARSLRLFIETLRVCPGLKNEIDWDLIKELTDSSNENVKVSAIDILKNYNIKNIDNESLFKIVDNYNGNAKAEALTLLAEGNSSDERILLLNSIAKSFAIDDPNTVISVVDKMNTIKLSSDELSKVSRNLCHYKEKGNLNPNWLVIKFYMGKVNVDLKSVCNE